MQPHARMFLVVPKVMNTPLTPEQIVIAEVEEFRSPYFFAFPIQGGDKILVHERRGCGINKGLLPNVTFLEKDASKNGKMFA